MKLKDNKYLPLLKPIFHAIIIIILTLLAIRVSLFFSPFLIGFAISLIIEKPVEHLTDKFKIPRKLAVLIMMFIIIILIVAIMVLIFNNLFNELVDLSKVLPDYYTSIANNVKVSVDKVMPYFLKLPPEILENFKQSLQGLTDKVSEFTSNVVNVIINTIKGLPNTIIYIIITFLATFFISSDKKLIASGLKRHFSDGWIDRLNSIINDLIHALGGYLKAQLIMISITFTELFIAFSILKFKYSLVIALAIAAIDAFPIVGTGTILIPWGLINLSMGNYTLASYLFIIYGITLSVRQLLEPKIVGQQIGIHPLLTLFAMYTGASFLGVIGLILGPVVLIIVKNILSQLGYGKPKAGTSESIKVDASNTIDTKVS